MGDEIEFSYGPICKFSIVRTGTVAYYFDWSCLTGEVWDGDFCQSIEPIHVDKVSKRL